jgi:hypothetical protein
MSNELTREQVFKRAVDLLNEDGSSDHRFEKQYQGRGHFTGPGIVTSASGPMVGWAVCLAIHQIGEETGEGYMLEDFHDMIPINEDNMGRKYIYY